MSFLDGRQHGFARVAVCVPPVRVADPSANAEAHVRFARRVHDEGARYAVFPELGLPGYTCGDLFFQRPLLDACLEALATVDEGVRFALPAELRREQRSAPPV